MSIFLNSLSLVLRTLTVLLDQKKSASSAVGGSDFLQLLACKRDGRGKSSEGVSIWCS